MNRRFLAVICRRIRHIERQQQPGGTALPRSGGEVVKAVEAEETAWRNGWSEAKEVMIIVPGYGMAVAQAQHTVYEITKALAMPRRCQCSIWDSSGRWPHAWAHECVAGRSQSAV